MPMNERQTWFCDAISVNAARTSCSLRAAGSLSGLASRIAFGTAASTMASRLGIAELPEHGGGFFRTRADVAADKPVGTGGQTFQSKPSGEITVRNRKKRVGFGNLDHPLTGPSPPDGRRVLQTNHRRKSDAGSIRRCAAISRRNISPNSRSFRSPTPLMRENSRSLTG